MAELIDSKEEKQTAVRNLGIIYSERKEYQKALGLLLSVKDNIEKDDYSYFILCLTYMYNKNNMIPLYIMQNI